ncbi:deoxyguanosinetriphosphate triphosphohydrolase [Camelimonas abortus]|uniref:Deoxyguanosinetriphosphate triphosphohydrolase-like protein n=1 Tax=Camelimonas abortus TaxID=1017184 RepID=A0ABV7LHS7_9HYPH
MQARLHGEHWTADYACHPGESRGRMHPDAPSPTRSPFQRDRDRIIHSTAFRRLKHKTQVFVQHEGDHYRTRLTHTIEVSQIARALARCLGLDEDLAEAVALAHDLGHTPFGHAGEDALNDCTRDIGGFDHNAQALRIVTRLERRYAAWDGLNLTWETLEGLVKHNGPLVDARGEPCGRYRERGVPVAILEYNAVNDLWLTTHASAEAQCAALADDIAYNAHDLDDGWRAGLFDIADLRRAPFLAGVLDEVERAWPGLDKARLIHEVVRRVITRFVEDAIAESSRRLDRLAPRSADDIRRAGEPVIAFSPRLEAADRDMKRFLFPNMYRHRRMMRLREGADAIIRDLYGRFVAEPQLLPPEWRADLGQPADGGAAKAGLRLRRRVADYIAGMTDSYALARHRELFGSTPDLTAAGP